MSLYYIQTYIQCIYTYAIDYGVVHIKIEFELQIF